MQAPLAPVHVPLEPVSVPSSAPGVGLFLCQSNGLSAANIVLGVGLIVGTFGSYLPQYYSIYRRKSTEGLNIGTIALGILASLSIFTNFCYYKWADKWQCCQRDGFGRCLAHTLDGIQILSTVVSNIGWTAMWLYYFKIDESEEGVVRSLEQIEGRRKLVRWVQLGLGGAISFLLMNMVLAGLFNTTFQAFRLSAWVGFLLGIVGTIAVVVQWAPQIWTTWKLQAVGSLSIVMLLIQLPGTLIVIYFQAVINRAHWSTVLPYVVCSVEFVILISLCAFFMIRDRYNMWRASKIADEHPDYKFAHLDSSIASTRVSVPTFANDEAEAESMMNLEFDGDDYHALSLPPKHPHSNAYVFDDRNEISAHRDALPVHTHAPTSASKAIEEVKRLLPSFMQNGNAHKAEELEEDDDDPFEVSKSNSDSTDTSIVPLDSENDI